MQKTDFLLTHARDEVPANLVIIAPSVSKDKMDNITELDAAQCLFGSWTSKLQIGISMQYNPQTPQSKWKLYK